MAVAGVRECGSVRIPVFLNIIRIALHDGFQGSIVLFYLVFVVFVVCGGEHISDVEQLK